MSLRIGLYLEHFPFKGGPSTSVQQFAEALDSLGHHPVIISSVRGQDPSTTTQVPVRHFANVFEFSRMRLAPRLFSYVLKNPDRLDLIVMNSVFCPNFVLIAVACQMRKLTYFVAPRTDLTDDFFRRRAAFKRLYWSLIEKPLYQKAGAIQVFFHQQSQSGVLSQLRSRFLVVPNGVDPKLFLLNPTHRNSRRFPT